MNIFKLSIFQLFIICVAGYAQNQADEILDKVISEFDKVDNYTADIIIDVDIDFMEVPRADAKLYFKKPDKVKVKAEDFALMPKEGLNFSPAFYKNKDYTAIYIKDEIYKGVNTSVIKALPNDSKSDIALSTLWIDTQKYLIRKAEITTKNEGSFIVEFDYPKTSAYPLPSAMSFTFDIKKTEFPKGFGGNFNKKKQPKDFNEKTEGRVFVTYKNYRVNKGVDDSVFDN